MADSAVARLRGILAATMTRTAIDQLLSDVAAEVLGDVQQVVTAIDSGALTLNRAYDILGVPEAAEPARCCMCGSADVRYRNYREQSFCWPCADGTSPEGKAAVAASLGSLDDPIPGRDRA